MGEPVNIKIMGCSNASIKTDMLGRPLLLA